MKSLKLVLIACLFLGISKLYAQKSYTVNGESLELIEEVSGTLTFYYGIIDDEYRYFVKKDGDIMELQNTKVDGKYQMEYRTQLKSLTEDAMIDTSRLKFVLYSLETFVNDYNESQDSTYERNDKTINLSTRVGFFGGITNTIFTPNTENEFTPKFGVELELIDPNIAPSQAIFFHLTQFLKGDTQDVSSTQFSINYRYRFILKKTFDIHADLELAAFSFFTQEVNTFDEMGSITGTKRETSTTLDSPISFSLGSDIRINENGFITLSYNDFYSIIFKDNGEFPVDFTVGYKYEF